MKDKDTIPAITYRVFKRTSDGLLKLAGEGMMNPPDYYGEFYLTPERACKAVYDAGDSANEYLILPVASWKWIEIVEWLNNWNTHMPCGHLRQFGTLGEVFPVHCLACENEQLRAKLKGGIN